MVLHPDGETVASVHAYDSRFEICFWNWKTGTRSHLETKHFLKHFLTAASLATFLKLSESPRLVGRLPFLPVDALNLTVQC